MDNNYTREELIEQFVQNKLSPEEMARFERQMAENTALREEVELMRHILLAIRQKGDKQVRDELEKVPTEEALRSLLTASEKQYVKTGLSSYRKKKTRIISLLSSAAAAILLLILFLIGNQPEYSHRELYALYHATEALEWTPSRSGLALPADRQEWVDQAFQSYQRQDYAAAWEKMTKATEGIKASDIPDEILFYSAICLSETDKTGEASAKFKLLLSRDKSAFREEAQWQLALLYLKEGKRTLAAGIAKEIIDGMGFYADQAGELLNNLNKKKWL